LTPSRTPVLVGAAQQRWRNLEPATAPDIVTRAAEVARSAADDTGIGHRAIDDVDAWIHVVGWDTGNPIDLIARAAGSRVRHHWSSGSGGEVGVLAANWAARAIERGDLDSVVVTGGTDFRTRTRAERDHVPYTWPTGGDGTWQVLAEPKEAISPIEAAHGMALPIHIYPIFENALRAAHGRGLDEHRSVIGALMQSFTEVAAGNPYAWFPDPATADELITPTPSNRMIGYPYTKRLNAILDVDLNAAYVMMSAERARSLGIDEDRFVYWWGGASDREKAYFVSERPDLAACPSMQRSHRSALHEAGVGVDDIALFDFYSCFPVAVEMACEMLGLSLDDPRRFTLTGGLPYAGGPGSAYTLHSLAAMSTQVRERPHGLAFVTGNGMWLSKHASSVWSGRPRPSTPIGEPPEPRTDLQEEPVPVDTSPDGAGVIEGYTVVHDRSGEPAHGIVVGRLDSGARFVANVVDPDALVALETVEGVGRRGTVRAGSPTNTFTLG
jgi:acetyl-CoA C-acetyltransferase